MVDPGKYTTRRDINGEAGAFPSNVIDAKRVIAWVRAHSDDLGADPTSLVLCGGSAGAYLAMMCALTAGDPTFQPGFEQDDTSVNAAVGFYGWYGSPWLSHHEPSSPNDYVHQNAPPVFVIHGARDPMISPENAATFVGRLGAASSSPVVYAELPGGQHNFDRFASIRLFAVIESVEAFLKWVRNSATT